MNIKFYKDNDYNPQMFESWQVFLVDHDEVYRNGNLLSYAPMGQHSEVSQKYLDHCTPITKEEYVRISQALYTPEEYLN